MGLFANTLLAAALSATHAGHKAADRFTATEKTGARIAETVTAVLAATHALEHQHATLNHANTFFALEQRNTWFVYFGWLEKDGSSFTPSAVVAAPKSDLTKMTPIPADKAPSDVTKYARTVGAARAIATGATGNAGVNPVLMPNGKEIDVYVMQGAGKDAVLVGGDFLFRFDPTGKKLLSQVQLHKTVIAVPLEDPQHPGTKASGSFHTHVIDEEPTVTDVAQAILHPSITPMFVQGRSGKAYRVDEAGKIYDEPKLAASSSTPAAKLQGVTDVPLAPAKDGGR